MPTDPCRYPPVRLALIRAGAWIRRNALRAAERATSGLPYWPDPHATCFAHGARFCRLCHRNGDPDGCNQCFTYGPTGMHSDTCARRRRAVC